MVVPVPSPAGLAARSAQRALGHAALVLLAVDLAVAAHLHPHLLGEGVDHGGADAVQAAGDLVGLPPNLPPAWRRVITVSRADLPVLACMSTGMPRPLSQTVTWPSAWMATSMRSQKPAMASSMAVVDDLVDQVVEAALVGGADVHAGAAAHRLQPFQHLDIAGGVVVEGSGHLC